MPSRNDNLRLDIIFTPTRLIAPGHWAFNASHHLSAQWELIVGVVLVVAGIPFLIVALRHDSD